jgi:asparagine synthase (glutamine-hydrolysing)
MCGIAGIYHYGELARRVDLDVLGRMTRALAHRGPDGEGIYVDGAVGLGHRRLAIIDLSPTGQQPMATASESDVITYNGEFYDHAYFRECLRADGHRFAGTSDTETLLHLLAENGPDSLARVAAIFSLAHWNRERRRLTLARDALGVKQLYLHDDGRTLVFASEIKALLEYPGVPRVPDPAAINEYLHFHTPLFDRTFFAGIRQVLPGEYLVVEPGRVRRTIYWRVGDFAPRGGSPTENVEALREQLGQVVSQQLMADVPVGAFLSGGIDSTAVAAFAAQSGKPPRCFGVHFTRQGVLDERPFQEAAARALGLELELMTLDGSSFPDDLRTALFYQDQPMIGSAMLPMFHVARLAARHVKVCVGGQAADEVFGGYARYALVHPLRVARSWLDAGPSGASRNGDAPSPHAGGFARGNLWKQLADRKTFRRLASGFDWLRGWRLRYFNHVARVPESVWLGVFEGSACVSRANAWETFNQTLDASPALDAADKAMHWDMQTYLPGLFHQDDRMSMASSLESRVPFADPRMVQFAFKTRFDLKFRGGASKWILRRAVADAIPADILSRRKVGFDTPAERWMQTTHADFVRDTVLSRRARERGLFSPANLERILSHTRHPLWFDVVWKALCIETWATVFLDGAHPRASSMGPSAVSGNGRTVAFGSR